MGQDGDGERRRGISYWRNLVEAYGGPESGMGEFPPGADLPPPTVKRRTLMQLLGASMALAGIGGCSVPGDQEVVAFAGHDPQPDPSVAVRYATSMQEQGYGIGLVVEAHAGRPTKIEGNPDHPASVGACGVAAQASILQLYDPDRARTLRHDGQPRMWQELQVVLAAPRATAGKGLAIVMEPTSSPFIAARLAHLERALPLARIHIHDPLAGDMGTAAEAILGKRYIARYDLARAQVVLALDSDLLAEGPHHLRHARGYAHNRRARLPGQAMNRLYVAESSFTCTGSSADHRLRLEDYRIGAAAAYLLEVLLDADSRHPGLALRKEHVQLLDDRMRGWIDVVAADLRAHRGTGLVVAGPRQPALVHALVHAINEVLGNAGATLSYADDPLIKAPDDLASLATDLDAGAVDTLVIISGNPVYSTSPDLGLGTLMLKARTRIALGMYEHETARLCQWFVPERHYLESWGDVRAVDGTLSIQQPLIAPLTTGYGAAHILMALNGEEGSVRDLLFASWGHFSGVAAADPARTRSRINGILRAGVFPDSAFPAETPSCSWAKLAGMLASHAQHDSGAYELSLRSDAKVNDGRYANNPWLQELPDPMTKLTWDNAALLSAAAGARLGITSGDVVSLEIDGHSVEVPALIVPGQADMTVSLALGYGRDGSEATAHGIGANGYLLRSSAKPWFKPGARMVKTGRRHDFAITQEHWRLDDADIVRERTWSEYNANPVPAPHPARASLRAAVPTTGRQWAMAVDMSVCIGCNACVVACQAENNIPVVGKDNVRLGREMHWIRIDRYYRGPIEDPVVASQPMTCQHCEKAPCEYVCPTYATTHSPDGLNEMTYNRCVGTRFCSNNCPYKVRRFNWYNFNDNGAAVTNMVHNPDVTVRARGVMEKCTGCVQRIREAEIEAAIAGDPGRPLGIRTACQQTCPTQAIVFGDFNEPGSEIQGMRAHPLAYAVLEDTGAQPRTRYLARLTNPDATLT